MLAIFLFSILSFVGADREVILGNENNNQSLLFNGNNRIENNSINYNDNPEWIQSSSRFCKLFFDKNYSALQSDNPNICTRISCRSSPTNVKMMFFKRQNGTKCGISSSCFSGQCVYNLSGRRIKRFFNNKKSQTETKKPVWIQNCEELCKIAFGNNYRCYERNNLDICSIVSCTNSTEFGSINFKPKDGTPCGISNTCISGHCLNNNHQDVQKYNKRLLELEENRKIMDKLVAQETADQYCQTNFGNNSFAKLDNNIDICKEITCIDNKSKTYRQLYPLLDQTQCGISSVCFISTCVSKTAQVLVENESPLQPQNMREKIMFVLMKPVVAILEQFGKLTQ